MKKDIGGQARRFGLAGIANTAVDYTVYMGASAALGLTPSQSWLAKAIARACAMACAFLLNRGWGFGAGGGRGQIAKFLASNLIGTFVIQLGLVALFSRFWPAPGQLAYAVLDAVRATRLVPALSSALVIKTVAFGLATAVSMVWNFFVYRHWVFAAAAPTPATVVEPPAA